jgi:hypothetical protein
MTGLMSRWLPGADCVTIGLLRLPGRPVSLRDQENEYLLKRSGQRTRGNRVCNNARYWKKFRCRHVLSTVSCTGQPPCAQSLAGNPNRAPRPKTRYRSNWAASTSNSVRVTRHGPFNPKATVNNPSSSIPLQHPATRPSRTVTQPTKRSPPRQPATPRPNPLDHQTHLISEESLSEHLANAQSISLRHVHATGTVRSTV